MRREGCLVTPQHRDLLVLLAQLAPEAVDDPVDLAHPVAAGTHVEDEVVEVGVADRLVGQRLVAQARGAPPEAAAGEPEDEGDDEAQDDDPDEEDEPLHARGSS